MLLYCVLVLFSLTSVAHFSPILNGDVEVIENYPFAVHLDIKTDDPSEDSECSGVIYDRHTIITAAHCLDVNGAQLIEVIVNAGGSNQNFPTQSVSLKVEDRRNANSFIIHSDYNGTVIANDIAIIRLTYPYLSFTRSTIKSGQFSYKDIRQGDQVTFAGWGVTNPGQDSNLLRRGTGQIVANENCNNDLQPNTFCVVSPSTPPCVGDSGSPIIIDNEIVGIASHILYEEEVDDEKEENGGEGEENGGEGEKDSGEGQDKTKKGTGKNKKTGKSNETENDKGTGKDNGTGNDKEPRKDKGTGNNKGTRRDNGTGIDKETRKDKETGKKRGTGKNNETEKDKKIGKDNGTGKDNLNGKGTGSDKRRDSGTGNGRKGSNSGNGIEKQNGGKNKDTTRTSGKDSNGKDRGTGTKKENERNSETKKDNNKGRKKDNTVKNSGNGGGKNGTNKGTNRGTNKGTKRQKRAAEAKPSSCADKYFVFTKIGPYMQWINSNRGK